MMSEGGNAGIEVRLAMLEDAIKRIDKSMGQIAVAMTSLVRMEETQKANNEGLIRAFAAIGTLEEDANKRLLILEKEMPTLSLSRATVFAFATMCMTAILLLVLEHSGVNLPLAGR